MNVNNLTIEGNLVRDPELKQVNDSQVCNFTIAVNDHKKNGNFFDVHAWGKTAEIINQYAKKGTPVIISGTLTQQRWKDQNGESKSRIVISCDKVFLRGRKNEQPENQDVDGY
jgi:single-strand DNA-binding protein